MNKENVISHFVSAVALIVVGAVSQHFISSDYTMGIGYLLGLAHGFVKPRVESLIFKK